MPEHPGFFQKSESEIRQQLAGFPLASVEAALRFRDDGDFVHMERLIAGAIELYRPKGCGQSLTALSSETRLREDLGLDSLSLTEMAFMFDELLGVPIETREVAHVITLGQLHEFLRAKLNGHVEVRNAPPVSPAVPDAEPEQRKEASTGGSL